MRAFITGISGFVGAELARHLLKNGWEVHGLVRPESKLWRLEDIKKEIALYFGDIRDKESVSDVLFKTKPDTLFHLAVHGAYPTQKDANVILDTSILSTFHLLHAAKAAGVRMFVNAGSSSEYGMKQNGMSESDICEPYTVHGVTKLAAVLYGQAIARQCKRCSPGTST